MREAIEAMMEIWTKPEAQYRYFLSDRIKTLKAIRAKLRPEPVRAPLPPPPKQYAPPRATTARRRSRRT
jgi:hypothetical protein